ncbi:hypothetical protein D9M71_717280 [compost metagenome]
MHTQNTLGQRAGNHRRRQVVDGGQQPTGVRQAPFTLVVKLADDARAHVLAPVVEFFLELVLDHVAFFFDHHDFFQALGKLAHALSFQRPDHTDLVHAQADLLCQGFVDAQDFQRLTHVEVGFSGCDNADSRFR